MELREYYYINGQMVESYADQLGLDFSSSTIQEAYTGKVEGHGGLGSIIGGGGTAEKYHSEQKEKQLSLQRRYQLLENELKKHVLIDLRESVHEQPEKGSLVIAQGEVWMPELMENIQAFSGIAPFVTSKALENLMDQDGREDTVDTNKIIQSVLQSGSTIPFLIDTPGYTGVFDFEMRNVINGVEIAELPETDITLIGKVTEYCGDGKKMEACNMFKLMKIGRSARRIIEKQDGNSDHIEYVEGPALRIKPLAIWQ